MDTKETTQVRRLAHTFTHDELLLLALSTEAQAEALNAADRVTPSEDLRVASIKLHKMSALFQRTLTAQDFIVAEGLQS